MHYRSISVHRLSFHLPGNKNCTFKDGDNLQKVLDHEKLKLGQLEAFFKLNRDDPTAREFRYNKIPQHYVWNELIMCGHPEREVKK